MIAIDCCFIFLKIAFALSTQLKYSILNYFISALNNNETTRSIQK